MSTIQEFIHASRVTGQYLPTQVSRFTAIEIREQIQILLAEGQNTLAQALGALGGEVTQVGIDHVWLRQWVADSQGQWQAQSNRWPGKGTP